jgi:hypothetical protein
LRVQVCRSKVAAHTVLLTVRQPLRDIVIRKTMNQRRTYRAKAIAAAQDRKERSLQFALALLVTGLLLGQLLLLIGP